MILPFALASAKEADREVIDRIYREFYPLMRSVASRAAPGDSQDAEDAVHDAMIKIINNISVIDTSDRKKLRSFCCIIARNCALDRVRKRENRNVSLEEIPDEAPCTEPLPEQLAESGDTLDAIVTAIASLPDKYRDPCILRYVHDCKNKEIAALLGITERATITRIHRGKMMLRGALRKEGYHE